MTDSAFTTVGEMLGEQLNIPLETVPFSGSAPAMQNVMAAQVPAGVTGTPTAYAAHQSGKAKIIGITGTERVSMLPDVPTFQELGIEGLDLYTFIGFFGPKGLPQNMAEEFNAALREVMADPEMIKKIEGMSMEAAHTTLEEAAQEVDTLAKFWKGRYDEKK